MFRVTFLIAITCFAQIANAQNDELTRKQAEFIQELKTAEGAVESLGREVQRQLTVVDQASTKLESAGFQVQLAAKEVRIRAAHLGSLKFGSNERERHLLKVLNRYQERIDTLQNKFNSGNLNASQKQQIVDQLKPLVTQRGQVSRQINRIKRDTHLAERKTSAEEKLVQAKAKLARTQDALPEPQINVDSEKEILRGLQIALQKAIDKLANLRLDAGKELNDLAPPFLLKLRIVSEDKKTTFYDATWESEESRVRKKIELINRIIEEQKDAIARLGTLRLDLAEQLSDVNDKWQNLNDQYIDLIGSEMWENIGVELGAKAASVLWNKKGTIVTNLFVEAGVCSMKVFMGYNRPSYDFPKIGSGAPTRESANAFDSLYSVDNLQATLSALASEYVADEGIENAVKKSGAWSAYQGMVNRVVNKRTQDLLANIKLAERMNGMAFGGKIELSRLATSELGKIGADTVTNIAKGAAIDQAKTWLQEHVFTAGKERIEVYREMFEYDLMFQAIMQDLRAAQFRTRNEVNKLTAANKLRDTLLTELDSAKTKRYLRVKKDEIVRADDNKAIIELTFTSEVRDVKVSITQHEFSSSAVADSVEIPVQLDGLPDIAELSVSAKDASSLKEIDSFPQSIASFHTQEKRWRGYEPGNDRNHRVRLRPLGDGVSLVFLFDCSGSMNDNNKLNEAKAAAKRILQDRKLFDGKNNEVSLWVFVGGFPRLVEEFTSDTQVVVDAINSLSPEGGTPLARSILETGDYLVNQGRFKRKALIVLSDGEDTENGNPQYAIQLVKEKSANVRREGW